MVGSGSSHIIQICVYYQSDHSILKELANRGPAVKLWAISRSISHPPPARVSNNPYKGARMEFTQPIYWTRPHADGVANDRLEADGVSATAGP